MRACDEFGCARLLRPLLVHLCCPPCRSRELRVLGPRIPDSRVGARSSEPGLSRWAPGSCLLPHGMTVCSGGPWSYDV
eukprot:5861145-Heterocapsa_arctica.AAC.1